MNIFQKDTKMQEQKIVRHPPTNDKNLKAFNAADELILNYVSEHHETTSDIVLANDRFGFLSVKLALQNPTNLITYKSQEKSIIQNCKLNNIAVTPFFYPFGKPIKNSNLAIIKIPKSLDLFELFLINIHSSLNENSVVIGGFMTKHFSKKILEIAANYFEIVEQSKAHKKARLLLLQSPKKRQLNPCINTIKIDESENLKQYFGVFSSKKIDFPSVFLTQNWQISGSEETILDLASGNGVLAWEAQKKLPNSTFHLIDDSYLAVESSKMNLKNNTFFHYNDVLTDFKDNTFDLILSNPPFHLEFENNIEVAITLFKEAQRVLKPTGNFQLVASKHLNFKTHLAPLFSIQTIADNGKFVIYKCSK